LQQDRRAWKGSVKKWQYPVAELLLAIFSYYIPTAKKSKEERVMEATLCLFSSQIQEMRRM